MPSCAGALARRRPTADGSERSVWYRLGKRLQTTLSAPVRALDSMPEVSMSKRFFRLAGFVLAVSVFSSSTAVSQPPDRSQRLSAKAAKLEQKREALRSAQRKNGADVGYNDDEPTLKGPVDAMSDPGHQHGDNEGHLLPTRKNVRLISKLSPSEPFGNVVEGQIADLAVHRGFAYLNSWSEPTCTRGGTYVVDIRRPDRPREAGFIPALPGNYHGEGAQALRLRTPHFRGNLLAVNNERCADVEAGGGFDLYDVSNPRRPKALVQGFGDTGPEGSLTGDEPVHDSHSVFVWQDGRRAYLFIVDNVELHDVDIFDVTNPRRPEPVGEFDLVERFPQIVDEGALGNLILFHDGVVKEINGTQTLLAAYWDAGYVTLDVDDPANPRYIGDTSFDGPDPLTGLEPQEGNAHQAEFSFNDRYIMAADEDFDPYRPGTFSVTTGPGAGEYESGSAGGGGAAADLPDRTLNGPVVYGGYGCNESAPVPQRSSVNPQVGPGEEAILVLQRGPAFDPDEDYDRDGNTSNDPDDACFPGEKAANAAAAGWDAVLLVNRHPASGSQADDQAFCGSGGFPPDAEIVTICTTHEAFHRMFNDEPTFEVPYDDDVEGPAIGTVGEKVRATSVFDGWGYAHLYRNEAGKMREIDAYAIPESLDERFASGFGDLSIHEWATDPEARLAYSSYYAGGFRVVRFGPNGIRETGRFIDQGGNNFWGVEQFSFRGRRLVALSDRDYGLYVFAYTGPGSGN